MELAGHQIDSLYAYLAVGADGEEGLVAMSAPNGATLPLVASDEVRMRACRPFAEAAAASGRVVRLVRFDQRTVLEEIVR